MKRTEWVVGVVAALAVLLAASVPLQIATAAPLDVPWETSSVTTSGPTVSSRLVNDGLTGPVVVGYDNFAPVVGGSGASAEVVVSAFTDAGKTVDLSYNLSGFHGFFQVTVELEAFVIGDGGTEVFPLVSAGPIDCCTPPSGGFGYTGDVTLSLSSGDTYGLRVRGSNVDSNSRLRGTLVVDQQGLLEPDLKIVNGYSETRVDGGNGLFGGGYGKTRDIINGPGFGDGDVFPTDLVLGQGIDVASPETLMGTDIFVLGDVASAYTADELAAFENFVAEGGTLIATASGTSGDVAGAFGLEQFLGADGPSTFVSTTHEIADGPFGQATGFASGPTSWTATVSSGPAVAVALDAGSNITMAEIRSGVVTENSGLFLFVGDPLLLGPSAETNETVVANLFAYAAGYRNVPPPPAADGDVTLLQAVPSGTDTLVTFRAAGGSGETATVELLTSATCVDGVLGAPTVFGEVPVTFTGDAGEAFFSGPVTNTAPLGTFVAARIAGATPGAVGNCVAAGPDNDTWTRALTIPLTAAGEVQQGSAVGRLDSPGNSRWYRFAIQPGAEVRLDLSNLPADYDLALFTDIRQAFDQLVGDEDVDGLNRLSAEFAPAVFSPAVFSPAVFSPAVFSPDAYSPAVFSPAVFSPAVFSPAVFSPAVFSPAVFSPAVFSPAVFSPAVFSPAVFSPDEFSPAVFSPAVFSAENYASAQARSIAAVSANNGTADEVIVANTWNETGFFYARVAGRNGVFDAEQAFTLDVEVDGIDCAGVAPIAPASPITAPAGDFETIILWDPDRMDGGLTGNDAAAMATLESQLATLAARPEVRGTIVDLGDYAHVRALHAQADASSSCPYAENLTASAVKQIIDVYRAENPDLRYVVLAGSDAQIPFFRYPDQALLGPEQNYDPPVRNGTQSQASLRLNYILGQDEYGASTTLELRDGKLPVPDLAVGRLAESADDMNTVLAAYLATTNGVVAAPTSTLVTGYDFLTDSAEAVAAELEAGTGPGVAHSRLITAADISPADPRSWTADDLRRELLGDGDDIVFLAGHFSANSALAADYETTVLTTELAASDVDLTNSLIFSGGCHSGYNIVDGDIVSGVTQPLDWVQAFTGKGATLVAGTGYQYGDTDFLEYSERLYALFARELRRGAGAVSVGEALARAKQEYLASTPELRPLHYKSVLISTVFGLPMLSFDLPGDRLVDTPPTSTVNPQPVTAGTPGEDLGLLSDDVTFAAPLTPRTVELTNLEGGTLDATYLEGPDGVVTNPAEPAIPLISTDVSVAGQSLRGVGFRSGSWTEQTVVPLTGAPTTELRGVHTPFVSTINFPMRLAKVNYFGALSGTGGTVLNLTPAQHRVASVGDTNATLRRFGSLGYRLYYSNNTQTYGSNQPALSGPPTFANVQAVVDGDDVVFQANVVGDPAAGIQEVWVTYTDGAGSSGSWVSLDLVQNPDDSTLWTGRLAGAAIPGAFGRLDFMIQASSGTGLVTLDDNYGAYYRVATPQAVAPAATELTLSAPSTTTYGFDVAVSATLTSGGSPVAGAPVLVSLAGSGRVATTDADGVATVSLPVTAVAGTYTLTAGYAGDASLEPTAASAEVIVAKAATTLTVTAGPGTLEAALVDATGTPLLQRTVFFTVGTTTVASITDSLGVARFDTSGITGNETVTVRFLGQIPTPGGGVEERLDPVYLPASATFTVVNDVTGPTITFSGATSYDVDGTVLITCAATDPSGVATSTCPDVASGPARTFGLGSTTLTATASDTVGNASTATVTFTVTATATGICNLTASDVEASYAYDRLRPAQQRSIDRLVAAGCTALQAITPTTPRRTALAYVTAYKVVITGLRAAGFLTRSQLNELSRYADSLVP